MQVQYSILKLSLKQNDVFFWTSDRGRFGEDMSRQRLAFLYQNLNLAKDSVPTFLYFFCHGTKDWNRGPPPSWTPTDLHGGQAWRGADCPCAPATLHATRLERVTESSRWMRNEGAARCRVLRRPDSACNGHQTRACPFRDAGDSSQLRAQVCG